MPSKRYKTEDIIHKLREAEVLLIKGRNVAEPPLTTTQPSLKLFNDGVSSL